MRYKLLAAFGLLAGGGVIYYNRGVLMEIVKPAALTDEQWANANIIMREFLRAGLPTGLAYAAIVNAYEESRLDHMATFGVIPWTRPAILPSDTSHMEKSSGLFMLNPARVAAGYGLSEPDRWNAETSIARITDILQGKKVIRNTDPQPLRDSFNSGGTVAELTKLFTIHIERPADSIKKGNSRADTARRIFPAQANLQARSFGGKW